MADEPELTAAAKREIAEAVRIAKEDRIYASIQRLRPPESPKDPKDPKEPPANPTDPKDPKDPPPPKDEPPKPVKQGVWWGDRIADDDE